MRVTFKTGSIPTRAAKRLKALLDVKESQARAWTAQVLGYLNWHELEQCLGQSTPSELDEDCSPEVLDERRQQQVCVLRALLQRYGIGKDAGKLLGEWQPSAGKPQVPAQAGGHPQATLDSPTPHDGLSFQQLIVSLARHPERPLQDEVVATLIAAVMTTQDPKVISFARSIASSRMATEDHTGKVKARRMLEAAAARGDHTSIFDLSVSLSRGDGGPIDRRRAARLLERLIIDSRTPPDIATRARSCLGAELLEETGHRTDRTRGLQLLEEAANAGSLQAAFNAALEHSAIQRNSKPANTAKAAHFYRLAADGGDVHAACNLGLLLLAHPEHANGPSEGMRWLNLAASQGDSNARRAMKHLDRLASKAMRDTDAGRMPAEEVLGVQRMMVDQAMKWNPPRRR